MTKEELVAKMQTLSVPCSCGSGKMFGLCHGKGETGTIAGEVCPCGSGKLVKDCCMKDPEKIAEHM